MEFKRNAFYVMKQILDKGDQIPILIGLRRLGKSTILKQLKNEYDNSEIILFDSIEIRRMSALELMNYLHSKIKSGTTTLLLDEVQAIDEWDLIVKELFDKYVCDKKIKVAVTGSSSLSFANKDTGVDRTTKVLIGPMDFDEYILFTGKEKTFSEFENFLLVGGFPQYSNVPIDEIDFLSYKIMKPIIVDDIPKHYKIESRNIERLLFELSELTNGEFNKTRSSKNTGIAINQIDVYLDILEKSQIIKRAIRMDEKAYQGRYMTQKIYINPHFHLWLLKKTFQQLDNNMKGHIIESYWMFANAQVDGYHYQYFYLKNKDNKEIDFVVPNIDINNEGIHFKTLIEFKYSDNAIIQDYYMLRNTNAYRKIVWCKEDGVKDGIEFKNIINFSPKDKIKSYLW